MAKNSACRPERSKTPKLILPAASNATAKSFRWDSEKLTTPLKCRLYALPGSISAEPRESASSLAGAASLALRSGTKLIRHVALKWCNDLDRRWSGRGLARKLGVSQTYIWKLTRQFKDGKLNVRSPLSGAATFEELGKALGPANWQSRKMREQGLLRCTTYREAVARMIRGF